MRAIRYRQIAHDLRALVGSELAPGSILPSEADLSDRYDASRVTVRRALDLLRSEGLVESRQGFGWIVSGEPLRQDLSRLATIDAQLASAGVRSRREVIDFGFVDSPERVRGAIGGDEVLEVRRLHLADDRPIARVTVWCPAELGASLSRDDVQRSSFLEQLPVVLGGATQRIGAATASAEDAALLEVPESSPTLLVERVTRSVDGRVVLVSEHVFPAHRMQFSIDIPVDSGLIDPSGMRVLPEGAGSS
ncbi:MAG: GntR family transcriptional regulator [Microthrixaceae bacterium]